MNFDKNQVSRDFIDIKENSQSNDDDENEAFEYVDYVYNLKNNENEIISQSN